MAVNPAAGTANPAAGSVVELVYLCNRDAYILECVTKRLIDIDDALLAETRSVTGAATMKEAVNTALQHLVESELRMRHVRRLVDLAGTDIADGDVMAAAWR